MKVTCHACDTHCCHTGCTTTLEDDDIVRADMAALERGVQVVVGTPDRVLDMINRGALCMATIKMLVVDWADELLGRGFKDHIYDVLRCMPPKCQVGLFSETMPADVRDIVDKFMRDPVRILKKVTREELTLEGTKQFYVMADREEWKLDTLCDLYETLTITQCIVYVNTRRKVDWLVEKMQANDFAVTCMYGEMDLKMQVLTLKEFRSGSSRVLIVTDDVLRGIDIQQVSMVINYDLPYNHENYIRRIARLGRFSVKGAAINFLTSEDVRAMREIEQVYNITVEEMPMNIADLI